MLCGDCGKSAGMGAGRDAEPGISGEQAGRCAAFRPRDRSAAASDPDRAPAEQGGKGFPMRPKKGGNRKKPGLRFPRLRGWLACSGLACGSLASCSGLRRLGGSALARQQFVDEFRGDATLDELPLGLAAGLALHGRDDGLGALLQLGVLLLNLAPEGLALATQLLELLGADFGLLVGNLVLELALVDKALGFPRRDPFDKDSHPASGADDFLDPVGEGPA